VIANVRLLLVLMLLSAAGGSPPVAAAPLPALGPFTARHDDAIVRVLDGDRHLSTGFVVASVGYAVAVLPDATIGRSLTVELLGGDRRRSVVVRKKGALVVLALTGSEGEIFASLPVAERPLAHAGGWLVALCHEDGALVPAAGGLREVRGDGMWHLDLPCRRGAPVLDGRGRVLAVTLYSQSRTSAVGVSAEAVRKLAQGLPHTPSVAAAVSKKADEGAATTSRAATDSIAAEQGKRSPKDKSRLN